MSYGAHNRSKFSYRPTIARRGLLIILIPVLLGNTFLLALDYLWFSSSKLVLADQHRNEVSIAIIESFFAVSIYAYTNVDHCFNPQNHSPEIVDQTRRHLDKRLSFLRALIDSNPGQYTWEAEVKRDLDSVYLGVRDLVEAIDKSHIDTNMQRVLAYDKLMRKGLAMTDKIIDASARRDMDVMETQKQEAFLGWLLKAVLTFAFLCGGSAAAIIFINFGRGFVSRVKNVARSASNLANASAQGPRIAGNDELAYLDGIFHDAAVHLEEARTRQHEIVQMVAHDMRSPIMAAQVSMTTVLEFFAGALPPAAAGQCAEISSQCSRILAFVNDFLAVDALQSGKVVLEQRDFAMRQLVNECIDALAGAAERKDVSLENRCSEGTIKADRERTRQVLLALLQSAVRAAPEGTAVTVSSRVQGAFLMVSVEDRGEGLSKMARRRVFDLATGTTGDAVLPGLHVCKLLVQCQGGKVGADSDGEHGRRIWFSLPVECVKEPQRAGGAVLLAERPPAPKHWRRYFLRGSLLNKILILVAVPVIVQGIWLAFIAGQLAKSQAVAVREQQQASNVATINDFWLRSYRSRANAVFYKVYGDKKYSDSASADAECLRRSAKDLKRAASANTYFDQKLCLDAATIASDEAILIDNLLAGPHVDDVNSLLNHMVEDIKGDFHLARKLERLTDQESQTLAAVSRENEERRLHVQSLIFAAIAFNVGISLLQWLAFRQDISLRFQTLVQNARKLAARDELSEEMGGADEIAAIDHLMHVAAAELAEADVQRTAVMKTIADNVSVPVAALSAGVEVLSAQAAQSSELSGKGRETIESVRRNIERVASLTDELLNVEKLSANGQQVRLAPCDLKPVIEAAIASVESLASAKNIAINADLEPVRLNADGGRLEQVMVNLLSNSIKFSPQGSAIVVTLKKCGGGARITVEDRGAGLSEADRKKIFDRYVSTTEQKERAFGLGLPICKSIVEAHGGEIGVDANPAGGSIFWIELVGKN